MCSPTINAMQDRAEQQLCLCSCICVCGRCVCVHCADDFPVIIFNAQQREHEHWLASVAKHCVAGNRTTCDLCKNTNGKPHSDRKCGCVSIVCMHKSTSVCLCASIQIPAYELCLASCQTYNFSKEDANKGLCQIL